VDGPALIDLAVRVVNQVGSTKLDEMLRTLGPRGADGRFRNLIFAGTSPKPDLLLSDSVDNTVKLAGRNADGWLYYDRPLPSGGLRWLDMIDWWRETEPEATTGKDDAEVCRLLYTRFKASLDKESPPEHHFFEAYCARIKRPDGLAQPALLPQVHLHYDPYTRRQRGGESELARERMDFLLLLPNKVRVVVEIDGDTHYGTKEKYQVDGPHPRRLTSPRTYAKMVAEDRRLRLAGYEVYRFGGAELHDAATAAPVVDNFFDQLLGILLR
jgi:very-short-patch-repair endonuclease